MADNKGSDQSNQKKMLLEDRRAAFLTLVDLLKTKKHFFVLTLFFTFSGTILSHCLKVPTFSTSSVLFVQEHPNKNAAELILNQHSSRMARADRIESYVNHLNSDSFLIKVAERIKFHKDFEEMVLVPPAHRSVFGPSYWWAYLSGKLKSDDDENKLLIPNEAIVGFLRQTVKYHFEYSSQFIHIQAITLEANTSRIVANLVAKEFVAITNQSNVLEISEIESFVKEKKEQAQQTVKELDKQLVDFKKANNIISEKAATSSLAHRLSKFDQQIESANLQKLEKEKVLMQIKEGRKRSLSSMIKNGSNQNFANNETAYILQNKIDQLKREKSAFLAQGFSETSWQIQKVNKEIDSNVSRLSKVIESAADFSQLTPQEADQKIKDIKGELQVIVARIKTLKGGRDSLQREVAQMPDLQQEYIQLQNQFKIELENLANLKRKEKELEIQRISFKKEVKVDQFAETPGATPSGSILMKLIFSSLAALFLGLLIILGLESLDPSVKSRQDLLDCGLDFYGEIPMLKTDNKKNQNKIQFGGPKDLVCLNKPDSVESMSFKYIRARIESLRYKENKKCQIITLSSAMHNEGKSFVSANLAISLGQLSRKVLLIDADLRRPSQPSYFNLSTQTGLVDVLTMQRDLQDVLLTHEGSKIDILPAGFSRNNSTELISGQKFRLLLDHLKKSYDYIVIDTPPTFAVVDASIIASLSDIPILVSSYRETRKADLYQAYNDLLQVSYKNVYGLINKAMVSNSRIHYYGYPVRDGGKVLEEENYVKPNDEDAKEFLKKLNKKSS